MGNDSQAPVSAAEVTAEVRPATPAVSGLVRGSTLYAVANIGDKVVSFFVLIPLYARFLSPAAYGIIALSDSVAQFLVRLFGLSLDDSLRRLYFQYVDEPDRLTRYVSTVLWSVLATVGLMLLLSFTAVPLAMRRIAPNFDAPFYPYIALSIGSAIGLYVLLYRQTLYQVESKPQKYLAVAATSFFLNVACAVILVVVLRKGAYGMLLAKLLSGVGIALIAVYLLRRQFLGGWDWRYLRETLHLSLPLIPHYLTSYGLDVADRFILTRYRPLAEVGIYSLAYTLGKSMYIVGLSVHQAWSPSFFSIARHGNAGKDHLGRMTSLIAIVMVWIAMAGTLASGIFISLFLDVRYQPAARIAPWIIASYLFQALYALSMLSAMQAKRSIFLFASSAAAFTVNVVLNFALVPRFGMYGSAYANFLAFLTIAVVMYFFGQRLFYIPYRLGRILGALAVYFLALGTTQWHANGPHVLLNSAVLCLCTALLYQLSGHSLQGIRAILLRKGRVVGDTESLGAD